MEQKKAQRTLKFYSKVKSGCLTCKKRKLKCDEAKPHCRRCTGTGRRCEGYRPDSQSPPALDSALATSHSGLFSSTAERRSFFYFQSQACQPLGGYFNASFWGREVMQAAIHSPPVRHLVIALGAAYEGFEAGTPGQGTRFTLQHCNRAISHLAALSTKTPHDPSAEEVCCMLTASLLFVYIASIRGQFQEAFQHVQSAAKILQTFERSPHRDGTKTSTYPVAISRLRRLIASVYGQLRAMVNDLALDVGALDLLVSDMNPATIFTSVPDAHAYVEQLFQNTLAFLQQTGLYPPSTPEQLEAAVARHKRLCQALESSEKAVDVLAQGLSEDGDCAARKGIVVLRLYHLLLGVRLRIDVLQPEQRESSFDQLEAYLEQMLRHCESLVHGQDEKQSQPSCSSGLGYVMPLHMIAARCRNPQLRRRALDLLSNHPRREGLWDASLAARIVSQTIEIEEQSGGSAGFGDKHVAGARRVLEVKLELQGDKTAALRFITVENWKQGQEGTRRSIEW